MTEQEWLAGKRSYDLIYHPKCRDDRKRRLLACACARRVLPFLHDERFARVVAECERYADAEIDWAEMLAVRKLFRAARADLDSARGLEYQNHAAGAVGAITAKEFMSF